MSIQTATLGYPRIGKNREVKKALESFWSEKLDAESLRETVRQVEETNWKTQREAGIDRIGIGDATLYDSVLDWSIYLGLIPERFRHLSGLEQLPPYRHFPTGTGIPNCLSLAARSGGFRSSGSDDYSD
ncbi:MAG: hypothetical protein RIM23_13860 [Coleofasciculus sp. G3-WIS-01]|uniref:hypothetical protein n=1 Tax=Coleofasciculus sp. G3-WIS-01 TaxID=3069528 RepID=UPI0032F972D9